MKYVAIVTMADGEQIINTVDAIDARAAHIAAADIAEDGAIVRVYPATTDDNGVMDANGVMYGALMVARRTAANAIRRTGGSDTQRRIDSELSAIAARCRHDGTAGRLAEVVAGYTADTQDYIDIAANGLIDAIIRGVDIAGQYHAAYTALNKHISVIRTATTRELSTEYIYDGGGDLIPINTAISAIIRGGDRWIPTHGGELDDVTAARLGDAIRAALATVRPVQRDIVRLLGYGYSQRQIADRLNRGLSTVNRNIADVRQRVTEYMRDNAPDLLRLVYTSEDIDRRTMIKRHAEDARNGISAAETVRRAAADKAAAAARAEAYKARKAEADKATQAARARRYRARKAARAAESKIDN